jgi:MFS family permease
MPLTPAETTLSRARWTIALAILLVAIIGVAMSMTLPLLSLRLDQAGWSGAMIGLNTSFMALATLSLAPFIPALAKHFGIRALLVTALLTGATATLGFGWAQSIWSWFFLRFMLGCALTVLFILSEFWINAAAPDDRRGLIMGIYGTVLSLGFASGSYDSSAGRFAVAWDATGASPCLADVPENVNVTLACAGAGNRRIRGNGK